MKEKLHKIFKNNIFCFILGVLITSTLSVAAATFFPSNNVTYDNKESGLTSTDVQGAIDELYSECFPPEPAGGNYILDNVDIVTSGDGLYEDEYEYSRYIYKGANPNNYITFNGEDAGWRIISIEPNKTIKIVRAENISNGSWSTAGRPDNNWDAPARLNTYLNETYYSQLDDIAKNQIVENEFSIGPAENNNNNMTTQVISENSKKWSGKIALPTLSEYIRTNSNKRGCGTFSLFNSNSSYISCSNTGWMDNNNYWWTLTPVSNDYRNVYVISSDITASSAGSLGGGHGIRPVLYLSSKIKITWGNGSQSSPFIIE